MKKKKTVKKQIKINKSFFSLDVDKEDLDFEERIINSDLIQIIQQLMKENKLNQEKLAKKLKVSPAFVSKLFSGEKRININILAKLQIIFDERFKFTLHERSKNKKANTLYMLKNIALGMPCEVGESSDLNQDKMFTSADVNEKSKLVIELLPF